VKVVPNQREASLRELTPGTRHWTLEVPIGAAAQVADGRANTSPHSPSSDQLLWGAAGAAAAHASDLLEHR